MKNNLLLILECLLLTLIGCKKEQTYIYIESSYNISNSIEIDSSSLKSKIDDEDDFILYIYASGCKSCEEFDLLLNSFIKENSCNIYKIESSKTNDIIETRKKYQTNPRIILFSNGNIKYQENINTNNDIFTDLNSLKDYLTKYIKISNLVNINYEDIDELISKNEIIYYSWNKCGDCSYLNSSILNNYIYSSSYSKFYFMEVDEYRSYKDTENNIIWENFVDKCKLDINSNKGKLPTFIKYNNEQVEDYVIYFNDELEVSNNSYKVIQTSYKDNGEIVGKVFSSYSEYQKGTNDYHLNKLNNFMNKYLKKEG